MKKRVKNAVQFICDFEEAVATQRATWASTALSGIYHCAEIRQIGSVTYYNDGDWVESCTALVEDALGEISIVDWAEECARARHPRDRNDRGHRQAPCPGKRPSARAKGKCMKLAICTDAWAPQVNGVVRTLSTTVECLQRRGHEVMLVTPAQFFTVALPGYSEIRLAMAPGSARAARHDFAPDIVHIATEGPIGWSARAWCKDRKIPFTSAFHTRFPDYAAVRGPVPVAFLAVDASFPCAERSRARLDADAGR
jgi:hypothetical protein